MIQELFRHFQCESASCITYLSANGGGRERKATYWGVESCWGTCTRKYSQVNIYSEKNTLNFGKSVPDIWMESHGKTCLWCLPYPAVFLSFPFIYLFDPVRSIKHLRMTFDPTIQAEKERAEKLLEAAKAEAISRVRYLTDFLFQPIPPRIVM